MQHDRRLEHARRRGVGGVQPDEARVPFPDNPCVFVVAQEGPEASPLRGEILRAVIELERIGAARGHAPAQATRLFEYLDLSHIAQALRGAQSRHPGADDCYLWWRCHDAPPVSFLTAT